MAKKLLIISGLGLAVFYLIHNISHYPTHLGYIWGLNTRYAEILTTQWRLPSITETVEAYNPPFFYLISGLFAKIISQLFNKSFIDSIKLWPYLGAFLAMVALYLWYQIIDKLKPKDQLLKFTWAIWIFSIPVFQKMMPMYTSEPYSMFMTALIFWYFIKILQPKPTIKKTIILSILVSLTLISRVTSIIFLPTLSLAILGLRLIKRIHWPKAFKMLLIFITINAIIVGPVYYIILTRNKKITHPARAKKGNTTLSKYGLSYYTDVPFKYMMTYPFRQDIRFNHPLNKLIPIYYSTFWGDYWNYYIQTRFNIDYQVRDENRYVVTDQRISSLVLQNRINLLPTLLLIAGFVFQIITVTNQFSKKRNDQWLTETTLLVFVSLLWASYLYYLNYHLSWKSDNVKACYMIYALPIFVYFATKFLFEPLKKIKFIFIPVIIWLVLTTGVNFWWAWF